MAVTDYLRGAGTSADPYIIHNVAAWTQFFNVDKNSGKYFEVITDIDCGNIILSGIGGFYGQLNGNGHKVSGFRSSLNYWFNTINGGVPGKLKNIHIIATFTGSVAFFRSASTVFFSNFENVRFDISTTTTTTYLFYDIASSANTAITNVIITCLSSMSNVVGVVSSNNFSSCYVYAPNISNFNVTGVTRLLTNSLYLPASYPTLGSYWVMDSVSVPYLYPAGRTDLTIKYAIKGSVKVAGIAKKRKIAVMTSAYLGLLKKIDTADDGTYLIDMADVYDPVYVMHYDDYGFPLFANTAYALGGYIHPKTPNGYRYKCTTAGTSGASLPAEPWPTSSNLTAGTAIFSPEPVYKTETFLVSPHLYDFITGQPV